MKTIAFVLALSFLSSALFAAPSNFVVVAVASLTPKDLGKSVIVFTDIPAFTNTGPSPPEGFETVGKKGTVVKGRLDSIEGNSVTISYPYPGPAAEYNRKFTVIPAKHILELRLGL
jgi:hypothetical protein